MKITEIRIRLIKKDDSKVKAFATVTMDDCLAIHDIKIIERDNGLFIAMPCKKNSSGEYKDIVHPLNSEFRNYMSEAVIEEYLKASQAASAL